MFAIRNPIFDLSEAVFAGDFIPGDNLAVDFRDEDNRLVVQAELPGVRAENIDVFEQNGFLTIQARNEEAEKYEGPGWRSQQQRYWTWQRSLRLPAEVNVSRARAELKYGVLTVTLPKKAPNKKLIHRIKVGIPKFKFPALNKKEGNIRVIRK